MGARYIGITGTIGSGKSTVLAILESWGKKVFRADNIAKDLLYGSGGRYDEELRTILGNEIFEGEYGIPQANYSRIRDIIVSNKEKRDALGELTSKIVWEEIVRRVGDFDGFVYVESALLHEAHWNDGRFERIMCVWCERETSIARLSGIVRNGQSTLSEKKIIGLLDAQYSASEKRARSDVSLYNGASTRKEEMPEYVRHALSFWEGPEIFKTRETTSG